jgi:hypothetical protein
MKDKEALKAVNPWIKPHWHLNLNTVITVIIFLLLTVLVLRQENLIRAVIGDNEIILVEQQARQQLERDFYNYVRRMENAVPAPTMETLIFKDGGK